MDNSDNPLDENFVIDVKTQNKVIDMNSHSTWGNSISFNHWETREIAGHMTPIPKKGDILISKMKSGKKGMFRIIEIRPCYDPSDMFFGTVQDIGYIEDIQEGLIILGKELQKIFEKVSVELVKALAPLLNTEEFQEFLTEYHKEQEEARKE